MRNGTESKKQQGVTIIVNQNWCKSCGICIEFCHRRVLGEGGLGTPEILRAMECNACRLCELRCPEMAIIVTGGAK